MRKFILLTMTSGLTAFLAAFLAACQSPAAKHGTYDDINAALNQAAAKPATPDAAAAALLPPLAITAPPAKPQLEERFSVSFNNVPAPQFFNAIVSGTRYNMLVHPEVGGSISANLKNVTLFEALDSIRDLYGYDYTVDGNRITIKPLTMQTRVFQVNYLTGARKGTSDTHVTSNSAVMLTGGSNGSSNNGNSNVSGQNQANGQNNNLANNNQNQQNNNGNNNNGLPTASYIDSAKVSTAYQADFWGDLKAALEAIISKQDGRSVVISPQSGVVVVRAMPDELRNVAAYLRASQLSVDRQVILEAKILEVQLNSNYQTGINWASLASYRGGVTQTSVGFGQPGSILNNQSGQAIGSTIGEAALGAVAGTSFFPASTNTGSIFGLALQTSNFAALISFLESQGSVHVLSNPRIATLNNQQAVLKVGTDDYFVTGVTTTTTQSTVTAQTSPTVTLEPFFSGVVLDVTPQIDADGNIILHVHPAVTKVTSITQTFSLGNAGTLVLPLASSSTQETDSIVRGLDGHIVAIGGLMRQTTTADKSDVPGASDVPLLGALFRNTDQKTAKAELVILIKPTIVKDSGSWDQNILESQRHVQELDPRSVRPLY